VHAAFVALFCASFLLETSRANCTQAEETVTLFSTLELEEAKCPTEKAENHVGLQLNALGFSRDPEI